MSRFDFAENYNTIPNRSLCSVLDDMRKLCKTLNFSPMPGLIEEAQILAYRMEAGLENKWDIENQDNRLQQLRREIRELSKKKAELESKKKDEVSEE